MTIVHFYSDIIRHFSKDLNLEITEGKSNKIVKFGHLTTSRSKVESVAAKQQINQKSQEFLVLITLLKAFN